MVVVLAAVGGAASEAAAATPSRGAALDEEVGRIVSQLRSDERVGRVYGAIAARHLAARQWGFAIIGRAELRPWQRALAPAVAPLIELLADDAGLEWVNENGDSEQVTTPRKEATLALLAFERPSVEPLIAALDRRELGRKADEVLRRLTRGGPTEATRAAWQRWWSEHREETLPNERGHLWMVLLGVVLLGGAVALVVWQQRRALERKQGLAAVLVRPQAPPAAGAAAAEAAPEPVK